MIDKIEYAVLDIETTGFSPCHGDKIVEISIISMDNDGDIKDVYETLINPKRDIGAFKIHGITGEMVINAPCIEDVIPDILCRLNGKVILGHNLNFDLRFINYELNKYYRNNIILSGICTLQLSRDVVCDLPSRKLSTICDFFDIHNDLEHSAYGDCLCTAKLFNKLKDQYISTFSLQQFVERYYTPTIIDMNFNPSNLLFRRSDAQLNMRQNKEKISLMINRLPIDASDSVDIQMYLNVIDDILLDRVITDDEYAKLVLFAEEMNISKDQVIEIHTEYIRKLIRIYLLDGSISDSEMKDLELVCDLLCVEREKLLKIIQYESAKISQYSLKHIDNVDSDEFKSYVGKSVCFTGELNGSINGNKIDRNMAHTLSMERGLIIKSGVSKNLDYLVTADPHSISGKAIKAKEIGVKIIAEQVFWNIIGVKVD